MLTIYLRRTAIVVAMAVMAAAMIATAQKPAPAQLSRHDDPQITLSSDQASHFNAALDSLARQAKRAIVVEATPLRLTLEKQDAANIQPGHLSAVLREFCKAYDYQVVDSSRARKNPDVIELRKQYTETYDLPDVTPEECLEALGDARRILQQMGGALDQEMGATSDPAEPIVNGAFDCLSANQRAQLASSGIPVTALNADQRAAFARIANYFYLTGPMDTLNTCYDLIEHSQELAFTSGVVRGKPKVLLVQKGLHGTVNRPLLGSVPGLLAASRPRADTLPDLTQVVSRQAPTIGEFAAMPPLENTTVQPSLANKSVIVVGGQYATPAQLTRAVADVYGLRYLAGTDGRRQIRRPVVGDKPAYLDCYTTINQVLPLALVNATTPPKDADTFSEELDALHKLRDRSAPAPHDARRISMLFRAVGDHQNALYERPGQIQNECIRRIEFLYHAKSKGALGVHVSMEEMGPEARKYYVIMVMGGFIRQMDDVSQGGIPPYIREFSKVILIGGENESERWIGLAAPGRDKTPQPMVKLGIMLH